VIAVQGQHNPVLLKRLFEQLLNAVAAHRVADRPDRTSLA